MAVPFFFFEGVSGACECTPCVASDVYSFGIYISESLLSEAGYESKSLFGTALHFG